ncbi:CYTH and CHAD domain-containing protein [Bosea sp. NBC_00550]|uniref:CYTH and CHAD domain-containing protein n=1 Tax=Bosea sp. NBC_00550 TaxID=2969621 RepID=UPI002231E685|nr:CYTH and CHAD domain-containing protein [Bosea sp. NBC_00550]UZF91777.1 CHAD domain-containing protein [Bosea sp. NBC_00550]
MTDPKEVELKLVCDAADLTTLQQWPRFAAAEARSEDRLESIYFDTPKRLLQGCGYVLRVRRTKDGYVQTVKAGGDGLIERPEWEAAVGGPEPDRDALDKTPLAKLLGRKAKLVALFAVSVERATCLMEHGNSQIEVALDQGRVTNSRGEDGAETAAISEIELELKTGTAGDLFTLAREIGTRVPVRLGVASKSERGFGLIDGQADRVRKAEPVALSEDMSAADAFRAVAHGCLRQFRLNEDILLDRRDAAALHQARVAVRRLRSAMSLFKDMLDDDGLKDIKVGLKRLSEPLGRARNLDVFLSETLPAERSRHPDQVELLNLEKHLESRRTEAYLAVDDMLRSEEWRHFLIDLVAWINAGPWLSEANAAERDQPVLPFASRQLDKRRRQVRKRGRHLAALDPEERHQARIAAKKLRYGAEFFAGLYKGKKERKRRKAFASALGKLQDSLGTLNDIASGHQLLEHVAGSDAGGSVLFAAGLAAADIGAKERKLLASAVGAHEDLVELRPFWQ